MADYESSKEEESRIEDIDPDTVIVVGHDWSRWLSAIGVVSIDVSTFTVSSGLLLGNASLQATKSGQTVTPPSPTESAGITAAHIWTDTGAVPGDELIIVNTVRAGARVEQRTLRTRVAER